MSWLCQDCDEDHPAKFRFCPISGRARPGLEVFHSAEEVVRRFMPKRFLRDAQTPDRWESR